MSRRLNRIRQAGVGLVEVMVATLVGAIVVIAVIQIFVANKQTFRMQDAMSVTQETGTFALDFIVRDALRAGYPGGDETDDAFDWVETTNVPGGNDKLAIVYRADSPDVAGTLCTGDTVTVSTARIRNRYWVVNGDLMCQGDEEDAGHVFQPVGTPQVLVSNVESFQVMFGVDLAHTLAQSPPAAAGCAAPPPPVPQAPTAYVHAGLVQAAISRGKNDRPNDCYAVMNDRQVVRSVRIGLLVATEGRVDAVIPAGKTYTVLDETVAPDVSDGRLRRQFTKTVILRNIEEYL